MALITVILFINFFQIQGVISNIYDLKNFNYEASVELNKEQLSEKQEKILNGFCNLLGVEDELCWQLKGNVYDEIIYVELYNSELEKEITNLYISEDQKVINIKKIYENIKRAHSVVGTFLPDWSGAEYISIEQIEYITGVVGEDLFEWNLNVKENEITIWQSIFLIFGIEKNKDGKLEFQTQINDYDLMFEVSSDKQF